jgi:predicted ribosomally synthesized peptide with nif11-like leader
MSNESVEAFFNRLSTDDAFAEQLAAAKADPAAVQQLIADAGFDVTPEEVRDAFLEHYGDQLTEEQLAAVAGGLSHDAENGIMVGSIAAGIVVVSVAGAAAAAA